MNTQSRGNSCVFRLTLQLTALLITLLTVSRIEAQSILINFESAPFSSSPGPNNFLAAGAMQSNGIAGIYSISGGVVLGNPTFLPSFNTNSGGTPPNLYGTADFADPTLSSNITLQLNPALGTMSVSGTLYNGQPIPELYSVAAYVGSSPVVINSFMVPADTGTNGFNQFFVGVDAGAISSVVISTPNSDINGWDFYVDSLDLSVLEVPEPQPFLLLGVGLLLGWCNWRRGALLLWGVVLSCFFLDQTKAAPTWTSQGPGPVANGQTEAMGYLGVTNPVAGGMNAFVPNPGDLSTVFAAAVNGGVWVTHNATAATPNWVNLTDQKLAMQSIASLAMSPTDTNTLYAGTGSTSNFGQDGCPGVGVARSTDGGTTWTLGAPTLTNRPVNCIVPLGGNVVLAGIFNLPIGPWLFVPPAPADNGGVYRSTDNGSTFTRLSALPASNLPDAGCSSMVADPRNTNRVYAAIPANGVYRSDDGGITWTNYDTGGLLPAGARTLLAVSRTTSVVYAMVMSAAALQGVYQSLDLGATWVNLGIPNPVIFPGGQTMINGAICADPGSSNVVFVAGDRQDFGAAAGGYPNVNGAVNYSANVFRGDASLLPANAWQNVVCNGAQKSSPHADSRSLLFYNGSVVYTCDGGMSQLNDPNNLVTNRYWSDLNGNIVPSEVHSAAYDALNSVVVAGAQDIGTSYQTGAGLQLWSDLLGFPQGQGDGADTAAGVLGPASSVRYNSQFNLGTFYRSIWNGANTRASVTLVLLNATNGTYSGSGITNGDAGIQADTPYILNNLDATRMLIGTKNVYESLDQGDTLASVVTEGQTGAFVGGSAAKQNLISKPLSYGSRSNGVPMIGAFYAGAGTRVWHRVVPGGPVTSVASPGNNVIAVVMDPQNYKTVYILDDRNRVFASFNEGANWTELTLNLSNFCSQVRCIELFSPTNTPMNTVLVAGGLGGVAQMRRPAAGGTIWTNLSTGLPRALVADLQYNYANNVLTAGILGRGTWTLSGYFRGGGSATNASPPAPPAPSGQLAPSDSQPVTSVSQLNVPQAAFASGVAPQITLTIQHSNGNISITWNGNGNLQSADSLAGPWSNVDGATSPYVAPADSQQHFYRVVRP